MGVIGKLVLNTTTKAVGVMQHLSNVLNFIYSSCGRDTKGYLLLGA